MGSHVVVYMGSSRAVLSEERKVSRVGRNSGFVKDSRRLGWPCWSSKGNQASASYLPFCLFLFHQLDGFIYLFHPSRLSGLFISFIPSLL